MIGMIKMIDLRYIKTSSLCAFPAYKETQGYAKENDLTHY